MLPQNSNRYSTNDSIIREALKAELLNKHAGDHELKIIEELGISHGAVRIDLVVVNGVLHGYEIKSDLDTLKRLPEQMQEYNSVFDQITLVVGKSHLYDAINLVPDWWGITIAKTGMDNSIVFCCIREPQNNNHQESISIARLLWREEALRILEEKNKAVGYRYKPREFIYARVASILDKNALRERVRRTLLSSREGWRSDSPLVLSGD